MSSNSYCNGGKKSSGTAKTALDLAIGGLSLAAVNSGLLGGEGGAGGLLGNLFGDNKSSCDPCPCYTKELLRVGGSVIEEVNTLNNYIIPLMNNQACLEREAAVNPYKSEKEIVTQWVLPLMARTCDLEKEVAVNTARDQEYKSSQQVIQSLMFRLVKNL